MASNNRFPVLRRFLPKAIVHGISFAKNRYYRGGWLLPYLLSSKGTDSVGQRDSELDIMVFTADHFEPSDLKGGGSIPAERVRSWCREFERISSKHCDSGGRHPQQTWFFRAEYENFSCLNVLAEYSWKGFGEIEFHLHHGFDTHDTFSEKLKAGLKFFNAAGAMITAQSSPQKRFGYVAGNWALDNGAGDPSKSGCNTELLALKEHGCYADFTFPAIGTHAQPRKVNSIYYATDSPAPKSYNSGVDVEVGRPASGDLMICQGPLSANIFRGVMDDGAIEEYRPPSPDRLDNWKKAHVHVRGRPDWLFVKLHCHGMQSKSVFCSPQLDDTFKAMVERWNRPPNRLHFVTAREAYNIVKAAEAGHSGDAGNYRDFAIPKPANRFIFSSQPWRLVSLTASSLEIEIFDPVPGTVKIQNEQGVVLSIAGLVHRMKVEYFAEMTRVIAQGHGELVLTCNRQTRRFPAGSFVEVQKGDC